MPLKPFSEEFNYQKSILDGYTDKYTAPLKNVMLAIKSIMVSDGFDRKFSGQLDGLRLALLAKEREKIYLSVGADTSKAMTDTQVILASLVKFLRHVYLIKAQGSQEVWVISTPKIFSKYISNELYDVRNNPVLLAASIAEVDERFTSQQKKALGEATNVAMKWCQATLIELSLAHLSSKSRAKRIVRRWFVGNKLDETEVDKCITKLIAGIRKVVSVISSNKIIFTDMPTIRSSTDAKDKGLAAALAFVYAGNYEKIPIIYIENGFFSNNSIMPDRDYWALTVIHEITHLELSTKDHKYDFDGLRPDKNLTPAQAIENADSWAYFCANAAKALSNNSLNKVLNKP
ncbi:M35 family metallo-endopeptidase [Agaribacter marinus]|uniref:Lysine-specific metallo-endopeptidase domain-containing protein n=1 Tax=Agaribacter marinus TaxID=1431249 RepID=A0AA37T559_9ALTE|nr:M35 family metallo-endopeptidase [Agaribacter marinus]GLR71575.1 hypothetical protein GCM10007852_24830 [Agaribacter marinus]